MSNEIARLARQLAEHVMAVDYTSPEIVATAERILATTTPLTMADITWDDEKHHLAGATMKRAYSGSSVEVVMQFAQNDVFIDYTTLGGKHGMAERKDLTPNGKRYELREIGEPEQPEHPAALVTEQDYANAPAGTVVAMDEGYSWTKCSDGDWWRGGIWHSDYRMADTERQVLREGWGK